MVFGININCMQLITLPLTLYNLAVRINQVLAKLQGCTSPIARLCVWGGGGGGGGAKHVISGSQDNTCMYGRADTARCRVCMKLRKPRGRCGRGAPLPCAQLGGSAPESGSGAEPQELMLV